MPPARATYNNWRDLEAETGRDLLTITGSIHASPTDADLFADARRSVEAHDVDHEVLTGAEVNERFLGYDIPTDHRAVYQPDGGFVDCEQAVIAHVEAAHAEGATVKARERVLDWHETGDGVSENRQGSLRSRRSGGDCRRVGWRLLSRARGGTHSMPADHDVAPARQARAVSLKYISSVQPRRRTRQRVRFPIHDVPGFKFGREPSLLNAVDPDEMPQEPTTIEEERHREFANAYFPSGRDQQYGCRPA